MRHANQLDPRALEISAVGPAAEKPDYGQTQTAYLSTTGRGVELLQFAKVQ